MIDAENLTRLLGHLPPKTFHELVVESFRVPLAALDEKQNKTEQRAAMSEQLLALPIGCADEHLAFPGTLSLADDTLRAVEAISAAGGRDHAVTLANEFTRDAGAETGAGASDENDHGKTSGNDKLPTGQ